MSLHPREVFYGREPEFPCVHFGCLKGCKAFCADDTDRKREVDAAVREALGGYVVSPLPRAKLASWFAMGRLPALRDEILSAWREQHA